MDDSLVERLIAVGIDPDSIPDPQRAFETLTTIRGHRATLDDRLALEARALGVGPEALPEEARHRAVEGFYGLHWRGFEMLGESRNDEVVVVDYDPVWQERFLDWRARITEALGETALRTEHVGSTAVPGLAAKPVIDIQVSLAELEDESRYVPGIEGAGVALRSRDTEHRYFRPLPGRPRDVHIHVCAIGSEWERAHLAFRDHLRSNDAVRDAYADLKRKLALEHPHDRLAYTEGKSEFIARALRSGI